ncbi:MAG: RnfABCDGE type electron transport complex subunit G [Clostridiaceae bacterium]|nr:RnfABCDGE type electron transport complex subunit G [Clostridiaceae bacterium]
MWDSIIKPTLILFIVCAVITGALAYVNGITENIILVRAEETQKQYRKEVMSEADSFVKINPEGIPEKIAGIYEAYSNDTLAGYVIDVVTKGYGGSMNLTVGINTDGKVTGVIIGDNNETPGLGSKAEETDFIDQFKEVSVNDTLTVVKQNKKSANEIQAISGATITSRAVAEGVQVALDSVKLITEGGN